MAIERVIRTTVSKGIESDNGGIQYFSYTAGYKDILKTNPELERELTVFYKAPESILNLWYKRVSNKKEANQISQRATNMSPRTIAYKLMEIDGQKKAIFLYGKNNGLDWTMARPGNWYHYSVICNVQELLKAPIMYCSSPVVCCDIEREVFFPDSGLDIEPTLLEYTRGLDGEQDTFKLPHKAGFDEITPNQIKDFINGNSIRLDVLKKMIVALVQLKEGNSACRLVVADKKENMVYWVAALSYLFPLRNILNMSFCTYGYSIGSYDFNGVYTAKINGTEEGLSDGVATTDYNYDHVKDAFAVFDFERQAFAPQIIVKDTLFFKRAVTNTFNNNINIIEKYKKFILENTTYNTIDSDYFEGYKIYAYMETPILISVDDLAEGLEFAKKYATEDEKGKILDKLLHNFEGFIEDNKMMEIFSNYSNYCVINGLISPKELDEILLQSVFECFEDTEKYKFTDFIKRGEAIEKACNYMKLDLEKKFVEHYTLDNLYYMVQQIQDKQRIIYIYEAVCDYVALKRGNFKRGSLQYNIICKAIEDSFDIQTINYENRVNTLINSTINKYEQMQLKLQYLIAVYDVFAVKNYQRMSVIVCNRMVELYRDGNINEKREFINIALQFQINNVIFEYIIKSIENEKDVYRKIDEIKIIITLFKMEFLLYDVDLNNCVIGIIQNINQFSNKEKGEIVFSLYDILKSLDNINQQEIDELINIYIDTMLEQHPNFLISDNELEKLKKMVLGDGRSFYEKNDIVAVFEVIRELHDNVGNKKKCIYTNDNICIIPNFSKLKEDILDKYIEQVTVFCCQYWMNTDKFPEFLYLIGLEDIDNLKLQKNLKKFLNRALQFYIEVDNKKLKPRFIVNTIELILAFGYLELIDQIPSRLINGNIKRNEIIKILEKDIEDKENSKKRLKLLENVDKKSLKEIRSMIIQAYDNEKSPSIFEETKDAFKQMFSWSKRK